MPATSLTDRLKGLLMEHMEVLVLVLAILGCIFGLLGFAAAAVTAVIVLGWRNSTHKVVQVPAPETIFEVDAPKEIVDQLPSSPEPQTLQAWLLQQQKQASSLDNIYSQDLGD
jgi:hypothetical protein